MHTRHIQHLYWRAGFGINPTKLFQLKNTDRNTVVNALFMDSSNVTPVSIDLSEFNSVSPQQFMKDKALRQKLAKLSGKKTLDLNSAWIAGLVNNSETLRERMTLFWANHFVCDDRNSVHMQQFVNLLKKHALGNFGDFVKAISKSAAMIKYLNTKQNRKHNPNENFARELMELFTLGIGNYSEQDIKESARAFTGYNHTFEGEFWLRKLQHDYDSKTFLGRTGNFEGDDIIDIILQQRQCARFICEKIYQYFVNENLDNQHVNEMTDVFYGNYDITKLMRFVFTADWFYNEENIGTKIKSPIDMLVGMQKTVPVKFKKKRDLLRIQKLLGQVMLKPPNVAGWQGGSSWIDVNTIMVRLRLPSLLLNHAQIPHKSKGDFSDSFRNYYFKKNKKKLPFETEVNWDYFFTNYGHYSNNTLKQNILNVTLSKSTKAYLETLNKTSQRDLCVQLMSLPEYQMC